MNIHYRVLLRALCALVWILPWLGHTAPLYSQSIAPDVLEKIRKACVFIRTDFGEGSGFLTKGSQDFGIIVTAAHVITKDDKPVTSIQAYFNSGTEKEVALKPSLLGIDIDQDVAFLRIPLDQLPEPLILSPDVPVSETMEVVFAGFPYGGQLAIGAQNPSLSISKGFVSSVRMGLTDSAAVIQIDANVNPGNSGGPLLTTKGQVVGMVLAKVNGSQLGFAAPANAVFNDLMGDVASFAMSDFAAKAQQRRCIVKGKLVDPLKQVREVRVQLGSVDDIPEAKLRSFKQWPSLTHQAKHVATITKGEFEVEFQLPLENIPIDETFIQLVCTRQDGTVVYAPPRSIKSLRIESRRNPDAAPRPAPSPTPDMPSTPRKPPPDKPRPLAVRPLSRNQLPTPDRAFDEQVPGSILSNSMPLGNYSIRRAFIPNSMLMPLLSWNEAGDHLVMTGEEITIVDYPAGKNIQSYRLSGLSKLAYWRGDELFVTDHQGSFACLNLAKKKISAQWAFTETIDPYPVGDPSDKDAGEPQWLVRLPGDPLRGRLPKVFAFDGLHVDGNKPLEFAGEHGALNSTQDLVVTPRGQFIFTRVGGDLYRFRYTDGKTWYSEGTRLPGVNVAALRLLDSTDDQVVLMLAADSGENGPKTQLIALATADLKKKFVVEVSDYVQCMVRDKASGRMFAGGIDNLWIWTPRTGTVEKVAMPDSASTIDAIAVHPKGQTLAILCGATTRAPQLYLLDLINAPKSTK